MGFHPKLRAGSNSAGVGASRGSSDILLAGAGVAVICMPPPLPFVTSCREKYSCCLATQVHSNPPLHEGRAAHLVGNFAVAPTKASKQ